MSGRSKFWIFPVSRACFRIILHAPPPSKSEKRLFSSPAPTLLPLACEHFLFGHLECMKVSSIRRYFMIGISESNHKRKDTPTARRIKPRASKTDACCRGCARKSVKGDSDPSSRINPSSGP